MLLSQYIYSLVMSHYIMVWPVLCNCIVNIFGTGLVSLLYSVINGVNIFPRRWQVHMHWTREEVKSIKALCHHQQLKKNFLIHEVKYTETLRNIKKSIANQSMLGRKVIRLTRLEPYRDMQNMAFRLTNTVSVCMTKHYMNLPMFISSSVRESPMKSNWNTPSVWENFCTATE